MATYDKHESNRFAIVANQLALEYLDLRDKVLADSAARGFPITPGDALAQLLQAGLKAKTKLVEANGKIFEEERGRIYELADFHLKMIVEQARLGMLTFRNALKVYEEQVEHQLREQEAINELSVEQEEIAMAALRLIQIQVRLILQQYETDIRSQVLALKLLLDEAKVDLELLKHLTRLTITEMAEVSLDKNQAADTLAILEIELTNLREITTTTDGTVDTVKASAKEIIGVLTTSYLSKLIGHYTAPSIVP